jgi:hypothetical protein
MKSVGLCLTYKGVQNRDQSSGDTVWNGGQMCKENASNCMSASLWSSIRSLIMDFMVIKIVQMMSMDQYDHQGFTWRLNELSCLSHEICTKLKNVS